MNDLIKNNIGGKKVLLLFILTNILYTVMLTITIPKVMRFSGGMKLLDMMPTGYNAAYVNTLLTSLGDHGRNAYLFNQLPVDMIYPFMFAISSMLVLAYFLNKIGKFDSSLFYFCLIPLGSGLFDYCENVGIILMLNSFPDNSILLSQTTSGFSILKSFSTIFYFGILTSLLLVFAWRKLLKKEK